MTGPERQPDATGFALRDPYPWAALAGLARAGEAAGYRALFLPEVGSRDTLATLTGLAGETDRLLLGTGVVPLPARSPALLSMAAATVQERSGGRLVLGLGTGPSAPGALGPAAGDGRDVAGRLRGGRRAAAPPASRCRAHRRSGSRPWGPRRRCSRARSPTGSSSTGARPPACARPWRRSRRERRRPAGTPPRSRSPSTCAPRLPRGRDRRARRRRRVRLLPRLPSAVRRARDRPGRSRRRGGGGHADGRLGRHGIAWRPTVPPAPICPWSTPSCPPVRPPPAPRTRPWISSRPN